MSASAEDLKWVDKALNEYKTRNSIKQKSTVGKVDQDLFHRLVDRLEALETQNAELIERIKDLEDEVFNE